MLVRYQRATAGFLGGIILAAALLYGSAHLNNANAVIISFIGVVLAIAAGWYAFKR